MLLLFLACALEAPERPPPPELAPPARSELPPESDLPFGGTGTWDLDGLDLQLEQTVLRARGRVVLEGVYDDPLAGDGVLWVPADPGDGAGGIWAVRAEGGEAQVEALQRGGRPDQLALSPDGETLVFVAGSSGITSLWALPTRGGPARQLTNQGLTRPAIPGQAPAGFLPPPGGAPLRFEGDQLRWTVKGQELEARWR